MIVAFFESIKYSGHLFPIAFLRLFLGYYYLKESTEKMHGDFLDHPHLADFANDWLSRGLIPIWYQNLLQSVVIPYWQFFAYAVVLLQIAIGISFLLGFLVRPFALIASLASLNFILVVDPTQMILHHEFLFAVTFVMAWLGAGRCLGFDYFFFKRNRGIWW